MKTAEEAFEKAFAEPPPKRYYELLRFVAEEWYHKGFEEGYVHGVDYERARITQQYDFKPPR
jgi:hypothetical protein